MKPEIRHKLAQLPFEEKIRKVGELIRLRQKIKTDVSNVSEEAALLASLDKAAADNFVATIEDARLTRSDGGAFRDESNFRVSG